ncbi:MAG: NADH-quinone oxidoreductase subunit NuoK [bacterium]
MSVTVSSFLVLTSLIFAMGLFAVLTRSNIVAILMGIELLLNASALNIVAFSRFHGNPIEGQIMALFVIALAASEAAIAFGLLISFYRTSKSVNISATERLKDR